MQGLQRAVVAAVWTMLIFGPALLADRAAVADTDLYRTGFEAPEFLLGTLTGQNGFVAYADNSIAAADVVNGVARSGSQSVRVDGAKLGLLEGDYEGYFYPTFDYDPLAAGTPILSVACDLFFAPTGDLPGYAGLDVYDPDALLFSGMNIHTDGLLSLIGAETQTVAVTINQWHNLRMRLDFATRTTEFFLDDAPVGTGAFAAPDATRFSDADVYMETYQTPAPHVAYFDNYVVTASSVPEPGDGVLLFAGCLILGGSAWRRRVHRGSEVGVQS